MSQAARIVRGGWLALLVAAAAAGAARAQTVTLDEGSFRILVGGREVGTETFSIRQNGSGPAAVVIARGRVTLDTAKAGQELNSTLQLAGGTLRPAAYDLTVEGADDQKIAGRVVGSRFSARIRSASGENMREYLVSDGAILADDGIAHQYYFLAQHVQGQSGRVPLLIPRQGRQVWAEVDVAAAEPVSVGGQSVVARRLTVRPTGGNERRVWVDDQGRVLRLEVPANQMVAERMALPK
jgi:hypothetical protein